MVSHIVTFWREYALITLSVVILILLIIIFSQMRGKKTELSPVIKEIRKELRRNHIAQKKLYSEIDYLLGEIPTYIDKKVKSLTS